MKPFNLERALAGDPVVTRDGREVTQVTKLSVDKGFHSVVGVEDGAITTYTESGGCTDEERCPMQLFMATTKRKGWVNVYPNNKTGSLVFKYEETAKDKAGKDAVATVCIEWEQ